MSMTEEQTSKAMAEIMGNENCEVAMPEDVNMAEQTTVFTVFSEPTGRIGVGYTNFFAEQILPEAHNLRSCAAVLEVITQHFKDLAAKVDAATKEAKQ